MGRAGWRWAGVTASVAVAVAVSAGADRTFEVVSPRPVGVVATGMNGRGDVVGFEWAEDPERPGVIEERAFFARGKEVTYLPALTGYTATFPAAVSDDGLVVGRAGKAAPPGAKLRNQGFAWEASAGMTALGPLEGDVSSYATGVSRDGRRVSGISVGPGRNRACVWERERVGGGWSASALPHPGSVNSKVVALSGSGRCAAASHGGVPCLWTLGDDGAWAREAIGGEDSLVPRGVNDAGTVAGVRFTADGLTHPVVWSRRDGLTELKGPPGYVRGEASAVNNEGVVVGTLDGPSGSDVGPDAFVAEGGRVRLLTEGGPNFSAATAVNDRGQVAGVMEERERD